ncbi:Hypothetical predicted protein [Olea europaea subsp. europaea]|uniref:Uncharacterized protein n=1 Tax=Olea europaea subsp. europaea TaxID=158383 RepID=A0A8S0T8J0_OLEEU|nr:Hypothetical predicted protein [Olea europaea subsp. europaea]
MGPTYSDSLCRRYPFKNIRILVQPQSVWNVKPMSHLYFVQFQRNYKVLRLVLWAHPVLEVGDQRHTNAYGMQLSLLY